MRCTTFTCTAATILSLVGRHQAVAAAQPPQAPRATAITHVAVIDVVKGGVLADQTVIVSGSRISQIAAASSVRVPSGALVVDGRGKFLIPGLWDMHGHLFANSSANGADLHALEFPLYIANGVTGVRDMWTTLEEIAIVERWMKAENDGMLLGPRVVPTGTMISGPGVSERNTIVVTTPEAARRVVDSLVAGGARTIKVQNDLARDVYLAIADEAKAKGVRYVGHITVAIRPSEAAVAGQHSIEHATGLTDGCSREEAEIMRRREVLRANPDPAMRNAMRAFIDSTYDEATCRSLALVFVDHGTWVVPTFVTRNIGLPDDSLRTGHRGYPYTPAADRAKWSKQRVPDTSIVAAGRSSFARGLEIIGLMFRGGVGIMAGTDAGNTWVSYGFSLQDELVHMTEAGLPPLDALRTATLNPARFLGATDSLGSVAVGHVADLVLLDANPLIDIHNTQRICAVLRAGRVYDRAKLDSLLADAKRVADSM